MKAFWKRFSALLHARNKEFVRDRSALGWNILFPVLVIFGFAFAFSGRGQDVFKVQVVPSMPSQPVSMGSTPEFLNTHYVQFIPESNLDAALAKLRRHQVDMVVNLDAPVDGQAHSRYWINESSPKGYLIEKILYGQAAQKPWGKIEKGTVQGEEIRYVDWLISGLLGMNMMFSALFGVGYTIVRYRKIGVLKRLKATPIHAFEFLFAQVISRLLLLVSVTTVVYIGCNQAIHFRMQGSYFDLFIVMTLGAMCLISLGLLMACRTASEEFAGGILNMISWPMMFFSGVWFSLEGTHPFIRKAALLFPLTHVIDGARAIMTEGATLSQISGSLIVLVAMTTVFLALGSWMFRWR